VKRIWEIAWHRFSVIQGAVSDANARLIAVLFYFTFLLPFGAVYTLFGDPMQLKIISDEHGTSRPAAKTWHERHPVPHDIDSARQQG
jgi:hypothetical protein